MIIVISGPTAVGKTKLSIELAKIFNGEVINADSMQFYKNLDIGTAKVTEEEKEGIPHHLFDIKEVWEDFSIYDYQKLGRVAIDNLLKKGKTPIIVGGSALYIKSLLYDFKFRPEEKKDYSLLSNEEIILKIKSYGITEIKDEKNRRRIERMLERLENNTYRREKDKLLYDDVLFVGLTTERDILYTKINNRVDKMFDNGLLDEVKKVYKYKDTKSLQTGIGYKEVIKYLDKEITKEECIDLIKKNSRHYAKRQYTFLKHQLPVVWFNVNYDNFTKTIDEVKKYVLKFYSK